MSRRGSVRIHPLLLARDELSGWLNSFGQYKSGKGGDEAHCLELHRAGHQMVDRKTGDKTTISVHRAAVCIAGGIQPVTLGRALAREHFENGLAARLLLAMPPRIPRTWTDADIPDELHLALEKVFEELFSMGFATDTQGESFPADVKLSPEARSRFMGFFNEHNAEQAELVGDEAAAWSKLEGGAARLAMVIHCSRWAAGDPTLRDAFECDEQSIEAGIVLARWFGQEAKRIYAVLGESDEDREQSQLVEWIERRGRPVTVRDLTHGLRKFREDNEAAQAALDELIEAGLGRWTYPPQNPKGGRPSPQFELVTAVTVTETSNDDSDDEGNGDGDARDGIYASKPKSMSSQEEEDAP